MPSSASAVSEDIRRAGDQMAVCLAREIRDGDHVFVGVNSPLPMTAVFLAKQLHAPRCLFVTVAGSVDPEPDALPRSTNAPALCEGAASIFSNPDVYDLFARGGVDLVFLGAAQVDKRGRVNVSWIGDPARPKVRLPGGGGGAVIMPQAGRAVIWRAAHDRRVFVPEVDFVTQTGNLRAVVTPLAVLAAGREGLELESLHSGVTAAEAVERTGFPLDLSGPIPETAPPTPEERAALETVDPQGIRFSEFRKRPPARP